MFLTSSCCFYLNGLLVQNCAIPIFKGDIVALYVNWCIFKYLKFSKLFLMNQRKKMNNYVHNHILQHNKHETKLKYWTKYFKYKFNDVPYFLELDYTTLSYIMILNPATKYLLNFTLTDLHEIHFNSLFQLNWKYIV